MIIRLLFSIIIDLNTVRILRRLIVACPMQRICPFSFVLCLGGELFLCPSLVVVIFVLANAKSSE